VVNRASGVPLFRQIADDIESAIRAGRWQPGHPLPSMNEIAHTYGVNRHTARAAYRLLQQRGVVDIQVGDYTRVRQPRTMTTVEYPADREVGARMPTDEERLEKGIPEGVPVLVVYEADSPLEDDIYPADRTRLASRRHVE
jgi:DNA-binding transcriptional regulator YhcF (GntR family)